jgi:hypothetical protein
LQGICKLLEIPIFQQWLRKKILLL